MCRLRRFTDSCLSALAQHTASLSIKISLCRNVFTSSRIGAGTTSAHKHLVKRLVWGEGGWMFLQLTRPPIFTWKSHEHTHTASGQSLWSSDNNRFLFLELLIQLDRLFIKLSLSRHFLHRQKQWRFRKRCLKSFSIFLFWCANAQLCVRQRLYISVWNISVRNVLYNRTPWISEDLRTKLIRTLNENTDIIQKLAYGWLSSVQVSKKEKQLKKNNLSFLSCQTCVLMKL